MALFVTVQLALEQLLLIAVEKPEVHLGSRTGFSECDRCLPSSERCAEDPLAGQVGSNGGGMRLSRPSRRQGFKHGYHAASIASLREKAARGYAGGGSQEAARRKPADTRQRKADGPTGPVASAPGFLLVAFASLTTAKTAMEGVFAIKLENHHVLRLDRGTGKAGAVRVDEVQRR